MNQLLLYFDNFPMNHKRTMCILDYGSSIFFICSLKISCLTYFLLFAQSPCHILQFCLQVLHQLLFRILQGISSYSWCRLGSQISLQINLNLENSIKGNLGAAERNSC